MSNMSLQLKLFALKQAPVRQRASAAGDFSTFLRKPKTHLIASALPNAGFWKDLRTVLPITAEGAITGLTVGGMHHLLDARPISSWSQPAKIASAGLLVAGSAVGILYGWNEYKKTGGIGAAKLAGRRIGGAIGGCVGGLTGLLADHALGSHNKFGRTLVYAGAAMGGITGTIGGEMAAEWIYRSTTRTRAY